jgi:Guanylate-binding protein, N-terminal domain
LVVDSEGIGALDEDSTHDNKIFSLTILLSSIFIYNSVGSIDENAIQNLSLMVNLTKNIQFKSNKEEESEIDDYSSYFPSFFWIIRDFTLQLVDQVIEKNNNNIILISFIVERIEKNYFLFLFIRTVILFLQKNISKDPFHLNQAFQMMLNKKTEFGDC